MVFSDIKPEVNLSEVCLDHRFKQCLYMAIKLKITSFISLRFVAMAT